MLDTTERAGRSLAAADPGDSFRIDHILFDSLKALCHDLGLHEGDVVHCRAATSANFLLERPRAHAILLDRDWARFIRIRDVEP